MRRNFAEGKKSGQLKENFPLTAQDIRFTSKGDVLYAIKANEGVKYRYPAIFRFV